MACEFCHKCWRNSYTKFIIAIGEYPGGTPPDRTTLFLEGYATPEMARVKTSASGKQVYGGIYAQTMPQPAQHETYCPELSGIGSIEDCEERKREKVYLARYESLKVSRNYNRYPNQQQRSWIPKAIRQYVSKRDRYTCVYCLRTYAALKEDGIKCVVDHVIPLAKGGSSDESNLVFSCQVCNREKGTEIWEPGCRVEQQQELDS